MLALCGLCVDWRHLRRKWPIKSAPHRKKGQLVPSLWSETQKTFKKREDSKNFKGCQSYISCSLAVFLWLTGFSPDTVSVKNIIHFINKLLNSTVFINFLNYNSDFRIKLKTNKDRGVLNVVRPQRKTILYL